MLLRHAKAEPAGGVPDGLRKLDQRGTRQCAAVGAGMRAAELVPDVVLVSSAERTRQTWECVAAALEVGPGVDVVLSDRLYCARVEDVLDLIRSTDTRTGTLLVVGHEPTMSATAARLAGSGGTADMAQVQTGLSTASYAVLDLLTSWADVRCGGAILRDVVRSAWQA